MSLIARIATLARRDAMTAAGVALSAAWIFLVALFWLLAPDDSAPQGGLSRLATVMATILPLVLIWLAVRTARAIAILRAEAEDLRGGLAQLREAAALRGGPRPAPARAAPEAAIGEVPPPAATGAKTRPLPRASVPRPPEAPPGPVDAETLIRALNFPDGPDDARAIAALRAAMGDADHARALRSAQDVVTLLARHDLYMDHLALDPAPPELWRRLARGARGGAVAGLGNVRDQAALDTAAAMLQADEIFRDTAQHFLRNFDGLLARDVERMDDDQILRLGQTRSARAFLLLGRIAGIFG